ncbi:hypothetical protein K8S17_05855 [bacterium]|nr:hypothetical protein [bacterium]
MSMHRTLAISMLLVFTAIIAGCSGADDGAETRTATDAEMQTGTGGGDVLAVYPADTLDDVVGAELLSVDAASTDGRGSLMAVLDEATTIPLYETGDLDIENALISYRAKIKTEGLEGDAILEMWCVFEGMGEFFSRGLGTPVSRTTDWVDAETIFRLEPGQNPDNVRLNLVVTGSGTVWIDDIVVTSAPLE